MIVWLWRLITNTHLRLDRQWIEIDDLPNRRKPLEHNAKFGYGTYQKNAALRLDWSVSNLNSCKRKCTYTLSALHHKHIRDNRMVMGISRIENCKLIHIDDNYFFPILLFFGFFSAPSFAWISVPFFFSH